MSKNLITVTEDEDVSYCANLMLENNISSIIVIDKNGSYLTGIFTKSDLCEVYAGLYTGKNTVAEYVTERVFTVAPDETIHMVLMQMINNKISRVVVKRNNKPVGLITGHDLLPVSALVRFGGEHGSHWKTEEKSIA